MLGHGAQAELPFGLAAVTASHAVSVGLVDWSRHRVTLIVKIALQQDGAGRLSLARSAPPIGVDTFDVEGNLLHASDFAPYKPACDVYVVEDANGRSEGGRLLLGPLDLLVSRGETLGPRESTLDAGDPTGARDAWTQPSFDFGSFQSSPKTRRIPWPRGGFDVHLDRGEMRFHARVIEPFPRASVVAADGSLVIARPPLVLDTIAIDARAPLLLLCFRGLLEDPTGALAGSSLRIDLFDAEGNPARHAAYRSISPKRASDTTTPPPADDPIIDDTTTTTARITGFGVEQTAVAPMATSATRPLPFVGAERRSLSDEPTRQAMTLDALRAQVAHPVRPAWEAAEETVTARSPVPREFRAPPAAAPVTAATQPQPPPTPSYDERDAPTPHRPGAHLTDEPSTTTDDRPAGPASAAAAADAVLLATIQRELWKGERSLAEILAEHGLDDAAWRALKQPTRRR